MAHSLYSIIPHKDDLLKFSKAKTARAFYKDHYVDLITGITYSFSIDQWILSLDFPVSNHKLEKRFIHLFYELGFLFESLSNEISDDCLLGIDIEYTEIEKYSVSPINQKVLLTLISSPLFENYQEQFNLGYKELKAGNCYQFNLTGKYIYSIDEKIEPLSFIDTLWKNNESRGAYASATYIEFFDKLFLSNSPECLFEYEAGKLLTRPVKGTMRRESSKKREIARLWSQLIQDKKNQAELAMITDLLRNDLSRIDLPCAIVTKKNSQLLVPGLLHQYAEIEVNLRAHITLKNILEKIFPGGSITGAPKKRVMRIIQSLEARARDFYCGSTLVFSKGRVDASINIRSSVIDFKKQTLVYQSGSGITLLSEAHLEFEEMNDKRDSYINALTL